MPRLRGIEHAEMVAGGTAGEACADGLNRRPWSLPAPINRSVLGAHAIVTTSPDMRRASGRR